MPELFRTRGQQAPHGACAQKVLHFCWPGNGRERARPLGLNSDCFVWDVTVWSYNFFSVLQDVLLRINVLSHFPDMLLTTLTPRIHSMPVIQLKASINQTHLIGLASKTVSKLGRGLVGDTFYTQNTIKLM